MEIVGATGRVPVPVLGQLLGGACISPVWLAANPPHQRPGWAAPFSPARTVLEFFGAEPETM